MLPSIISSSFFFLLNLEDIDLMKNFLVTGTINKNPTKSVKNPGIIRSKAAKANAAPDIISYIGSSFFTSWLNPDLTAFKPSNLAKYTPVIDERKKKELKYETTFIGLKSSKILEFKKIENIYKVTVDFVSEIITCAKDKNNQIIEGNPDTIKTVNDVWKFSKNMWSQDPTWYLVETSLK